MDATQSLTALVAREFGGRSDDHVGLLANGKLLGTFTHKDAADFANALVRLRGAERGASKVLAEKLVATVGKDNVVGLSNDGQLVCWFPQSEIVELAKAVIGKAREAEANMWASVESRGAARTDVKRIGFQGGIPILDSEAQLERLG